MNVGTPNTRTRFRPSDLTDTEWAYFAGIIDGEGCICYSRGRWQLRVGNTNQDLIMWLYSRLGGGTAVSYQQGYGRLPMHTWYYASSIDIWLALKCALPYMVVKRAAATHAIHELGIKVRNYRKFARENTPLVYLKAAAV